MILVPANKVEKIKYCFTLLGLIFIEITRGPSMIITWTHDNWHGWSLTELCWYFGFLGHYIIANFMATTQIFRLFLSFQHNHLHFIKWKKYRNKVAYLFIFTSFHISPSFSTCTIVYSSAVSKQRSKSEKTWNWFNNVLNLAKYYWFVKYLPSASFIVLDSIIQTLYFGVKKPKFPLFLHRTLPHLTHAIGRSAVMCCILMTSCVFFTQRSYRFFQEIADWLIGR